VAQGERRVHHPLNLLRRQVFDLLLEDGAGEVLCEGITPLVIFLEVVLAPLDVADDVEAGRSRADEHGTDA